VSEPRKRVRREAPESSYNRLLDAAEALFAAKGFYGATMRAIADMADTKLSMTTYHFRSKEDLFNQVILRRAPEHVSGIQASLNAVVALPKRDQTIERLILAFVAPVVDRVENGVEGWRNYIQLLSRAVSLRQDEPFLAEMQRLYDPVRRRFVDIAGTLLPDVDEDSLYWSTYFLNSALERVLTENQSIDRLSGKRVRSSDFQGMLARLPRFFGAGFRTLP